jgi:Tol biopolymer transport system component/DNA-binding winged helix-turn-helix (wHTH) protein
VAIPPCIYKFGPFQFDTGGHRLLKENAPVSLTPKSFELLRILIENPGRAISKSELLEALWPDSQVEEGNLAFQVSVLRKALGPEASSWIETVPRYGYRLSMPVVVHPGGDMPAAASAVSATHAEAVAGHASRFLTRGALVIVALGVTLAIVFRFPSNHTTPMMVRPSPLTTFRGFEANPALSPDGNRVAFAWNGEKQDNFDIYVMAIPSGTPVRLTTNAAEDMSPAWSPDGHSVAFLRRLSADRGELMVVSAEGGTEHKVAETREQPWFSPRKPGAIAWYPDGRWIAASHRDSGDRSEGIYLFSLAGQKRRLTMPPPGLHSDRMPSFSPDGRALAFCRLPGGFVSEIYVMRLDTSLQPSGEARRVTDNKRWSAQPVWTDDGRSILHVFGDDASKGREIRSIEVANPHRPAKTIPVTDEVSEIALGRHLVYSRQIEDTNIWRAELPKNGSPPAEAELFISSTQVDQTPRYSPDGKKIAFISSRSGSRELWVSNADRTNAIRMTFFNGPIIGHPSWSPDGQWITFHARPEGPTDIFVMPASGGAPKRLTTNRWEDHYPNFSRDGRSIYFSSRRSGEMQIWKMSPEGEGATQITTSGGAHNPAESPDGKAVFYHLLQDPGEIWRISVRGGQTVRIAGPTQRFPVGYTVTPEGIYYGAPPHAGEQRFIRFLRFSTGQDNPAVLAKRPFHSGMSVSPDSRYIIFDQYDESGSDLMIIENFTAGNTDR